MLDSLVGAAVTLVLTKLLGAKKGGAIAAKVVPVLEAAIDAYEAEGGTPNPVPPKQ